MTDRELLELAAKAAEIEHIGMWNPLADDGDALRLAVKLKLDTNCKEFATACSWFPHTTKNDVVLTHDGSDPYAATRRAIVRAAAEIGKGMA